MPEAYYQSEQTPDAVRMENITKRFGSVIANRGVHLRVRPGTFHALVGENGAGKSTLLNILYGRYRPDEGRIYVGGEEVTQSLNSPSDSIKRGIGLVSQHYALIPALTVYENIVLGAERTSVAGVLNRRVSEAQIQSLAQQLGLTALELNAPAGSLSVAAQQKVEILKSLYRGANVLLLDEPTATLAPQEADALFALLKTLAARGTTVVFVTHKLQEVMAHSHAVSVLRAGRNVGDFATAETDPQTLLHHMIGPRARTPLNPRTALTGEEYEEPPPPPEPSFVPSPPSTSPLLELENLTVRGRRADAVRDVTLQLHVGEIVGVAGVDGSGQRELSEAIVGLRPAEKGRLFLAGRELTRMSVRQRQQLGVSYIPEDRHHAAVILDFSMAENYLLGHERSRDWGGGLVLNASQMLERAKNIIKRYDVRAPFGGEAMPVRNLSGGNQQKVVVARAMDSDPRLLIACQPTRGLDVNASRFVYQTLRNAREQGLGVLLFSLDLDEIFALSDRIAVMFNGRVVGVLPRAEATHERVGALMTGSGVSEATSPTGATEADVVPRSGGAL